MGKRVNLKNNLKVEVKNIHNNMCARCDNILNIDIHHIQPRALGGEDTKDNLIPLCKTCHKEYHKVESLMDIDTFLNTKTLGQQYVYNKLIDICRSFNINIDLTDLENVYNNIKRNNSKYINEIDNKNFRNSQKEGIAKAKAHGKHLGRPKAEYPDQWEEVYNSWKAKEINGKVAMEKLGFKRTTFYKLIKQYEGVK